MTNPEIIAAVERWQTDPRLYPLTCRASGDVHGPLQPIEKDGHIMLVCPNCGCSEDEIPDVVLKWNGDLSWLLGIAR